MSQVNKDFVKEPMPQLNSFPNKQTEVAEGIMRSNEITDAKSSPGYCFRGKFRLDTTYDLPFRVRKLNPIGNELCKQMFQQSLVLSGCTLLLS